ncbi:restriction endonuclease [Streptacidiphilus sp. EB103A]|uniref:restriction endonuclease n=1 Tax=Streptacidiphilus sp. EB103A TaxID=3156275 RepID=UPI003519C324
MTGDDVLLESRTMRAALAGRIEALERVKPLGALTLPNGLHLLTEAVADYFAVPTRAVHSLVLDHREELEAYGYQVLTGQRLTAFKNASGIQSRARQLALFNRRTVLCAAMLLRESDIARQVRSRLLDLEAGARFLPVDNPLRQPAGGVEPDPVEVASTALRAVIGSTVVPLLNALLEQAGTQELALGEVRCRLEQLELMIVEEDGSARLGRRFHLVHGVEPAAPEDGGGP